MTENKINQVQNAAIGLLFLQLSLKTKWFKMTKSGVKTEDYRLITPYWCNRLLLWNGKSLSKSEWAKTIGGRDLSTEFLLKKYITLGLITFNPFEINKMTLGYPKSTDTERVLKLEHKGIEIRTGDPEWGAEPNKLYFVIKHGAVNG